MNDVHKGDGNINSVFEEMWLKRVQSKQSDSNMMKSGKINPKKVAS